MIDKNEKTLLNIIKYTPSLFILILILVATIVISIEHKNNIQNEKIQLEKQFIEDQKKSIKSLIDALHLSINDIKSNTENKLKAELKEQVTNGYKIAYKIHNKYKNTKTKEEIVDIIKSTLREIRHNNGRGYFFVFERKGKNILNAEFPRFEGKNLWNYKDAKGTLLLQEMYKLQNKQSEVFYNWYWYKPSDRKTQYKKIGFFKKFEPYDWFIGTGEYVDDFSSIMQQDILAHIQKIRYKDDRYIFISDYVGKVLINKYHNLVGKNITNIKGMEHLRKDYANREELLKEGLFVEYKLNENITKTHGEDKISYLKLIEGWNWLIGTGFDLKNAKKIIEKRQNDLENKYNQYLQHLVVISIILIIILLLISHFISKYIEKIFFKYKSNLEKKHDTLLKAQKNAKIGDWRLDLKSMEAQWSEQVIKMLGIKEKPAVVGPEFLKSIMYEDDWDCFESSMQKTISEKHEHSCIYRVLRPIDNKTIWIDCRGQLNKEENAIYGTVQDITDRKLVELEKDKNEAILYQQSKMAAMGEMLSNIAHQWRQPLSVISTAATGVKIRREMNAISEEEINLALDSINKSSQYLSQTIDDFRTFFDPKHSKETNFTSSHLLDKTLNILNAQFTAKNIEIIQDVDDVEIKALENELVQVLINLLNNSRDALLEMPENQLKLILISTYQKNDKLIIDILDNANGINEDIINRVFEPYFTTKHKSQGTGIGLYMSQEIVQKLLKGTIKVSNKEFKYDNISYRGANFIIELNI